jgi:tyrosyl-tRNA synthetase
MELATAIPREEIAAIRAGTADGSVHPRDAKVRLGKALVAQYHSAQEADEAARWFNHTFSARIFPNNAQVITPKADWLEEDGRIWIIRLLTLSGVVPSGSEASRLIRQGGVKLDGDVILDRDFRLQLDRDWRLQVGKRGFFRVKPPK